MASISSMVWFSKAEFAALLPTYEEALTVTPEKGFDGDDDPLPIQQWVVRRTRVGVPIASGLAISEAEGIALVDETSPGSKLHCLKRPDPSHPSAPKGQGPFFDDIIQTLKTEYAVLAEAPTGSGKTVAILNAVAEFSRTSLIIVPSQRLLYQWRDEIKKHLGIDDSSIGLIGDGHDNFDRPIVVCVLHNLLLKIYPQTFYSSFGLVAFDECHKLGAREFSRVMHQIPATFKIAVSATPDRKDGCACVFTNYFGEVAIRSTQKPLPLYYEMVPFKLKGIPRSLNYRKSTARPLLWVSENPKRNAFLVELIKAEYAMLSDKEPDALLVVTKYQEHAELLMSLCSEGRDKIPAEVTGLFAGKRKKVIKGVEKHAKVKKGQLDFVAANARVIFATYSMMSEGVDIPRISRGVEAMPVADVRQVVGRARRIYKSKKRAYWVSLRDVGMPRDSVMCFLYGFAAARIKGLREVGGVTVKETER